ncbi:dermonecrotic toxin domain-containing protein [Pseudomonas fluorescens]|uniref:dermonecrotic toxin domain-containing protein n=1 Tax=Pseudomonas fluorescens TaxID=294 RepID=UPI001256F6B4|nr:DUF6543 domain-containing protein [Pseudomonas fluorescens]VVM67787.1 hypothetical protein PS639_01613 [Pseudomonas fluorescens]
MERNRRSATASHIAMPDRLLFDLPLPAPAVMPPFSPVQPLHDESLFLNASARWRESSQGLRELVAASPGMRDTLDQLLKQTLDLDGQQAGLLFAGTDEQPECFVSFTHACAFVLQHPTLETTLDQRCRVTGLRQAHPLTSLTPVQMLERFKTLDPEQFHGDRWRTFWAQRAPGTAVSRQARVIQLYRQHFEAAAQLAFARKALTEEQLKPLQLLIDPPVGALTLNEQPIHTEQVALVLSNHIRVKLTGAWVITTGDAASARQLLYLPGKPVAIQVFNQRSDMENWLSGQGLVPTGLPTDNMRFEYTANTTPLIVGASDLFAAHLQAQVTALRHGTRGKPGLATHGAQSLVQADQVDRQRSNITFFASPPRLETADDHTETDETSLFGNLYADIPLSLRQVALNKQRDALETLVKEVGESDGLQPFKHSLEALETAEQAADKAASGLLNQSRALNLVTFQQEFTALHSAHKAALHAEATLQQALKQLDDDEYSLLKALLDTPDDPGPDPVAASLTLSMTEQAGDTSTVTTEELKGAFIVIRADALSDADSPQSVLLYWLGTGGGLQRFANLRELERQVFKIHDRNNGLTVQPKKITGDALLYGLNQLTSDFEEQADALSQLHAGPAAAEQLAEQLDILRQSARATLQVPVHAARNLAFAHLLEQDRSGTLAANLPDWLINLKGPERTRLKKIIEAYISAMHKSHELMTIALEPRDDFTRKHLHARLSKDFSAKGHFAVQVELPDSTKTETVPESGVGGTRKTTVIVPGSTHSKMSLEDLAQLNVDNVHSVLQDSLSQRLVFMRLKVTATLKQDRIRLLNGINLTYLRKVLPELDLPKAYEKLIFDAFKGTATEPVFVKEHRRESLIEPWRLMLKIQGECARLQKHINNNELEVLNIAVDASTPEAWRANGKRVALLPASLKVGGKDTPREGPVTLSGVTFIEEQVSGVTLLYLPDSHDGQFLRRYDSLEAARKGLYTLCGNDKWIDYLAGRTLQGNVRAHVSRINQAVEKNFDGMIEVGVRWPTTTSLAAHLLDAHMGRLVEAHRGTSRSNDDLFFERHALKGPRAFNYMKMAIGMVPFVGTALSLYDAWTAANQAAAAFLRGDVADGLAEIGSMLLSLIDAFMDLLPGEAVASGLSRTTRALTRTRQLHQLVGNVAAMQGKTRRQARHVLKRFVDYEYEKPISLSGVQPATHGLYRGIYRHADGDFIERQGRLFQVELSKDSRHWRLFGNSRKTYKQPIALDETGRWDTWYGLYGTTFEGGGLGGGQVLGHLADALDPVWPLAIRERLPRWWASRIVRRIDQLEGTVDDLARQYTTHTRQTNAAIKQFNDTQKAYKRARQQNVDSDAALEPLSEAQRTDLYRLAQVADTECVRDIELGIQRYEALDELQGLISGNTRTIAIREQSDCAWVLADRFNLRIFFASKRINLLVAESDDLLEKLYKLPKGLDQYLSVLEDLRKIRIKIVSEVDQIEELVNRANRWLQKVTPPKKHKANPTPEEESFAMLRKEIDLSKKVSGVKAEAVKVGHLLEIIKRVGTTGDRSWLDLQQQTKRLRTKMEEALFTHHDLPDVSATREQRNQILQDCHNVYMQFSRELQAWSTSYPQHFHQEAIDPLLSNINKLAERARKGIGRAAAEKPTGQITKKIFTTEDDRLLIGTEQWETTTQKRQYVMTGADGAELVMEQGSNGKFRLLNPPTEVPTPAPTHTDLATLVSDAKKRMDELPTHQARVQGRARPNSPPVELEEMMTFEANELTRSALRIETLDARNPVIQTLRNKAAEHQRLGRQMRTSHSLVSKKPTDGMLDDLIGQNAVELRRSAPIKNLSKPKQRADYMQEYEVWDLTQNPPTLLWYAHFHYSKAAPAFGDFEKAHLKLREHQFLTHADDADLPYSDIGKQSVVLRHFEEL